MRKASRSHRYGRAAWGGVFHDGDEYEVIDVQHIPARSGQQAQPGRGGHDSVCIPVDANNKPRYFMLPLKRVIESGTQDKMSRADMRNKIKPGG